MSDEQIKKDEVLKSEAVKDDAAKNETIKGKNGNENIFKRCVNYFANKLKDLRGEFRKIVWPSRETLVKHTITTIVISLLFGAFITLLDALFGIIFTSLVGFIS